ncbi:MAG: hypothetical protein ABEI99_05665, partial [Halobaculum sp.]
TQTPTDTPTETQTPTDTPKGDIGAAAARAGGDRPRSTPFDGQSGWPGTLSTIAAVVAGRRRSRSESEFEGRRSRLAGREQSVTGDRDRDGDRGRDEKCDRDRDGGQE